MQEEPPVWQDSLSQVCLIDLDVKTPGVFHAGGLFVKSDIPPSGSSSFEF